jgi:hypothetical protein
VDTVDYPVPALFGAGSGVCVERSLICGQLCQIVDNFRCGEVVHRPVRRRCTVFSGLSTFCVTL